MCLNVCEKDLGLCVIDMILALHNFSYNPKKRTHLLQYTSMFYLHTEVDRAAHNTTLHLQSSSPQLQRRSQFFFSENWNIYPAAVKNTRKTWNRTNKLPTTTTPHGYLPWAAAQYSKERHRSVRLYRSPSQPYSYACLELQQKVILFVPGKDPRVYVAWYLLNQQHTSETEIGCLAKGGEGVFMLISSDFAAH